ncbi:hypothetical protein [Thalassotalea ganghwensis]
MAYPWRDNFACTSVYAILRSKKMLDQSTIPSVFSQAGDTKLGSLTYYPKTSNDQTLRENQATIIANTFVNYLDNLGVVESMEADGTTIADIKNQLKAVFMDGDKTLVDVAEALDDLIKFFDE